MTLGGCVVKGLLPRMMLLWRNAFPRNVKELESEKARGDGFTWKMSLEARAGALASIHSFLQVCFSLKLYNISEICQNPINSAIWYLRYWLILVNLIVHRFSLFFSICHADVILNYVSAWTSEVQRLKKSAKIFKFLVEWAV